MVEEYAKCSNDLIYFVETYMKIINLDDGLVNFKLYDYQKTLMNNLRVCRNNIITQARQSGKSTTGVGYLLWYILFHEAKKIGIFANNESVAIEILGRLKFAYEHLPKWLQQGVKVWGAKTIELENNSKVIASATTGASGRSHSLNIIFIDEAAHIDNWTEFFTAVIGTTGSGKNAQVIMVSTPKGLNHFWEFWSGAETRKNNYQPFKVTWDMVPGRDERWKKEMMESINNDEPRFNQEQNCEFEGSSGTLIAGWKLKQLTEYSREPLAQNDYLRTFSAPYDENIYVCIVDVARGKGLDYSAFSIINVTEMPYRQVAVYRNNSINPIDYAAIVYHTCMQYNQAHILVEINDIGGQVADILAQEYQYENMISTEVNAGRAGKKVALGFKKGCELGVRTTKSVKALGCSMLKLLIEQSMLIIPCTQTIYELSTFSKNKKNSFEAEVGKNDDLVMGLVLFGWLSEDQFFKELTSISTLSSLREKTNQDIRDELAPMGFYHDATLETSTTAMNKSVNWLLGDFVDDRINDKKYPDINSSDKFYISEDDDLDDNISLFV